MSQARRILKLLQQLQKKEVCAKALSFSYFDGDNPPKNNESALRLAQLDIKLVREFFTDSIVKTRSGCYRLIGDDATRSYLAQHKENKSFRQLFAFLALFEKEIFEILGEDDLDYIQRLKQENRTLYSIHGEPIEKLTSEWLEQLKKAVRDKRYISITVHGKVLEKIQPYRIVFAQGNWYLASFQPTAKVRDSSGFEFVRINSIKKVEFLRGTFHPDGQVEYFIQNFQTLFEKYQGKSYPVKV